MKILLIHNYYQQPGGEDVVFAQEAQLLERRGHRVITYTRTNHEADNLSGFDNLRLLRTIISSDDSYRAVSDILSRDNPDLVHIHNTFMMISPTIYKACEEARVPTVQTLHNYRLLCPKVTLYRDGHICEECMEVGLTRSIRYGCYRDSRLATVAVATMLKIHRNRGTWDGVTSFIALTEFARRKFIEGGLPSEKIHVKPNFVYPDPGERTSHGTYVLFAGRLSGEKGVPTLLQAWTKLVKPVPLKIAGDGPERTVLEEIARTNHLNNVEFLGTVSSDEVRLLMKGARFLVVPSVWFEGFPMVIAESLACGVPVIASGMGAMQEIIEDNVTGLHFTPGDPDDLAQKVQWAWNHPTETVSMGKKARSLYESKYGAEKNYEILIGIYNDAVNRSIQENALPRHGLCSIEAR